MGVCIIPEWIQKLLPYGVGVLLVIGLCVVAVVSYNSNIKTATQTGYDHGVEYQKGIQAEADLIQEEGRQNEKERIEREAADRIAAANADRTAALASAGRLQSQLDRVKRLAEQYTGPQSTGTSATTVIRMLADMLEQSNQSYRDTADEADGYYRAGRTCELSYDSLRKIYDSSKTGQAPH